MVMDIRTWDIKANRYQDFYQLHFNLYVLLQNHLTSFIVGFQTLIKSKEIISKEQIENTQTNIWSKRTNICDCTITDKQMLLCVGTQGKLIINHSRRHWQHFENSFLHNYDHCHQYHWLNTHQYTLSPFYRFFLYRGSP